MLQNMEYAGIIRRNGLEADGKGHILVFTLHYEELRAALDVFQLIESAVIFLYIALFFYCKAMN